MQIFRYIANKILKLWMVFYMSHSLLYYPNKFVHVK